MLSTGAHKQFMYYDPTSPNLMNLNPDTCLWYPGENYYVTCVLLAPEQVTDDHLMTVYCDAVLNWRPTAAEFARAEVLRTLQVGPFCDQRQPAPRLPTTYNITHLVNPTSVK